MVSHFPELLCLLAGRNYDRAGDHVMKTRSGGQGDGAGVATPILMRGMRAMLKIDDDLLQLRDEDREHIRDNVADHVESLDPHPEYNILALAAPRHARTRGVRHTIASLKDLFESAYIGFKGTCDVDKTEGKFTVIET